MTRFMVGSQKLLDDEWIEVVGLTLNRNHPFDSVMACSTEQYDCATLPLVPPMVATREDVVTAERLLLLTLRTFSVEQDDLLSKEHLS